MAGGIIRLENSTMLTGAPVLTGAPGCMPAAITGPSVQLRATGLAHGSATPHAVDCALEVMARAGCACSSMIIKVGSIHFLRGVLQRMHELAGQPKAAAV